MHVTVNNNCQQRQSLQLVQKNTQTNKNLSPAQLKAIKSIKERENIVVLKADKGNVTVVMDREEYHKKYLALLQPPTYVPLPKDPTAKVERRVTEV